MITNISKKKIIIKKHKIADNIFSRAKGLMFSRKSKFDYGLIFDLERDTQIGASIHMFFVFFPINIVFLDSKKQVIDIKIKLKPFRTTKPRGKCRYVLELPIKYDKKYFSIGDRFTWWFYKKPSKNSKKQRIYYVYFANQTDF